MNRLLKRVRFNVRAKVGMSNEAVEHLCSQLCTKRFQGVFSADRIPTRRLSKLGDFVIVVNLGKSDMPVGHFVALSKRSMDNYVEYMDSFALPCFQPDVKKFVAACSSDKTARCTVKKRVQSMNSAYCGLYAALFAAYKDREEEMDFELKFNKRELTGNDNRCVDYLRRIIKEM